MISLAKSLIEYVSRKAATYRDAMNELMFVVMTSPVRLVSFETLSSTLTQRRVKVISKN